MKWSKFRKRSRAWKEHMRETRSILASTAQKRVLAREIDAGTCSRCTRKSWWGGLRETRGESGWKLKDFRPQTTKRPSASSVVKKWIQNLWKSMKSTAAKKNETITLPYDPQSLTLPVMECPFCRLPSKDDYKLQVAVAINQPKLLSFSFISHTFTNRHFEIVWNHSHKNYLIFLLLGMFIIDITQ